MRSEKDFYKHLYRKDLEPPEKQVSKFIKRYRRSSRSSIVWFYIFVFMFLTFQLVLTYA